MMNTKRLVWLILITLALLGLPFSRARAKEVVQATLSGPGLAGEIQLSAQQDLEIVSAPWYDLVPVEQPTSVQEVDFYVLRLEIGAPDEILGSEVFNYYPGAGDRSGYFFFAECKGCSSNFEAWYQIRDEDDLALRNLLVGLGAPGALIESREPNGIGLDRLLQPGILLPLASLALIALLAFAFFRNRTNKTAIEG